MTVENAVEGGTAVRSDDEAAWREVLAALHAVRQGDFQVRLPRAAGVQGEVADAFNDVTSLLSRRNRELLRISRVVGREGRVTERLDEEAFEAAWGEGIRAINNLIDDLGRPTTEFARVIVAVAEGDLSQHMALDIDGRPLRGEFQTIGRTVNKMMDQLSSFADEVTRVAREVGTEGKLGGQADVRGVSGTWRDLTDNVNFMASNLTNQVRSISQVTTAIAEGDLSQKINISAQGEVADLADTINSLTRTLRVFAEQVTRVAREVGTEGKLGGQADVPNVAGTWKDLTEAVNYMASNLTSQVRNISQVATAVAKGDLSQKITVAAQGEILELKDVVNTMVDQLSSFAGEVTRVAREVGSEGKLGGQAQVSGVSGTWRDLTENVNQLAGNLTAQVRNIAQVTTAVAQGDLSQKITVDARGEILELKSTVNTMVDQLSSFADEVTRVAREVGSEGKLGGQAQVSGVSGTWRDLTENVNQLAGNLTAQVRNIAQVTTAVAQGDLSQKITVDARGEILELKSTVNTMVDQLSSFADEVTRVAREVGTEGKLGGQAQVRGVAGTWRDLTDNVNFMASNLTSQVRNISQVATAVAKGDLSQKITVAAQGEILELKDVVNTMVDQLSSFADEVTRVAREVGTEGKLGGQAQVRGVAGTWRDLTDNVNFMASNLTSQVRNIAQVTTAVAQGDLSQKITVDAYGEILELKSTVNTMVDQLSSFADEVTRVAREVGTEGKLGGQAQVRGVSGTWRDLTENVNQLASTLTTQLRAIAEVSTAVTRGDLTQRIDVGALGEVAELKDNINQMIVTLGTTTRKNAEQGWLDSNIARTSGLLQGQRDLSEVCKMIISEVAPLIDAQVGAFFLHEEPVGATQIARVRRAASYGLTDHEGDVSFALGSGLVGQAGADLRNIRVAGSHTGLTVQSGTATMIANDLIILPVIFEGRLLGVIEFATVSGFSELHVDFLDRLVSTIGVALNTILANRRTEELLDQSQRLAHELREQSAELQRANNELEEKASLLSEQNRNVEIKNREIELARTGLEEKAQQLTAASRYKSEFLANMSHELRTPLNSLLLLARLLADNTEANLTAKQIEFARTIHNAGSDLMALIDDILDLSKIEAGRMDVELGEVSFQEISDYVERAFRPQAEEKNLLLHLSIADELPASMLTDAQRLQQILRNLMANAVKFTDVGSVSLDIRLAPPGTHFEDPALRQAGHVVMFSVHDSGIGISAGKLALIFDEFKQADGTTSRKYGGTGLGLSISRELARLLGGSITVASTPGEGSVFTLYLPGMLTNDPATAQSTPILAARPDNPAPVSPARQPIVGRVTAGLQSVNGARLDGAKVLIVDDDVRNVFALTSALELHGLRVLYADNGTDGVRLLAENPDIDIVLMDAMMPEQDGYETTRIIRRNPHLADLPVIFLTAKAMPGDRDTAVAAGASDYITKPVDLDELLRLMASWMSYRAPQVGQ
ncbi:HAMP domain-containing protein/signal transduction histidine kinase/ActR/RegA family two-component response regulator [Allocatelliglobosispora scoriae]|uniref:Circadian input-output histidine kinase CikA n=1 Tax=Allocatelliglobosispora scoriae TaxID=643052 RepID=A0A841BKF4_9ACTN|nr:HAMP domain-containing protein [Allocatelliglobosispora scoriae]MBB5868754.1 HAMP domain-containing protein/signal transduction histidine kinase/ActR/RegA family two-component response regulator [Allocatelliglobosispora scoriae]